MTSPNQVTEQTIKEIVWRHPSAISLFEELGLDYASVPQRLFRDACALRGLQPADVLDSLKKLPQADPPAPFLEGIEEDQVGDLIHHIFTHYHEPHRKLFRTLEHALDAFVPPPSQEDTWHQLRLSALGLIEELQIHMMKEEHVLFPAMLAKVGGSTHQSGCPASMNPEAPMRVMEMDHAHAGQVLSNIRSANERMAGCSKSFQQVHNLLLELWQEVNRHMYLENEVLFPAFRTWLR
ncbi:MAG: hemerythrin domain-containing protein [Acidobacteria bacterium]|nr:hemerythrin domain-containing protein [Acidobacteriota bacterium]